MSEKQENYRARVDSLADEIVKMAEAEFENEKGAGVAQDAMLLAQHRLFGDYYLSKLLVGLYPAG